MLIGCSVFAAIGVAVASPVRAQAAWSATPASDYRYRGRSFSENRPTATLNLSYDHKSGAYAGAALIGVDTAGHGLQLMGFADYVGMAGRTRRGLGWDAGLSDTRFTYYKGGERTYRYREAYVGALTDHFAARIYYSPNYLGLGQKTLYVDFGAAYRPAPDWRVFGHFGALTPVGGRSAFGNPRERYDASIGASAKLRNLEIKLSASKVLPEPANPTFRKVQGEAVTLAASYFF